MITRVYAAPVISRYGLHQPRRITVVQPLQRRLAGGLLRTVSGVKFVAGTWVHRTNTALVRQRLLQPGIDRRGAEGVPTVEARGFPALRLAHFYRTVGWLWRRRERIERRLYDRGRYLFNEGLDLVFFDTTCTYFEGRSG